MVDTFQSILVKATFLFTLKSCILWWRNFYNFHFSHDFLFCRHYIFGIWKLILIFTFLIFYLLFLFLSLFYISFHPRFLFGRTWLFLHWWSRFLRVQWLDQSHISQASKSGGWTCPTAWWSWTFLFLLPVALQPRFFFCRGYS